MKTAPIALFVYKRPLLVRQTIEALQQNILAEESDLFIFSDAPKDPKAADAVCEVRKYIRSITGFRSVNIIVREKNWGLANSIIDGVTQLCNEYGRVIVLEDDLLVSIHFLEYMNTALSRYENDTKVMQISGHMFPVHLEASTDAFFLPITTTWGWATWSRAWARFDPNMGDYERLVSDSAMMRRFDLDCGYPCLKMLKSVRAGKIDAWGIRWYLSIFMNNGLVLFPAKSLVENKGFDAEGTNCRPSTNAAVLTQQTSIFKVRDFPIAVQCSETIFDTVKTYLTYVNPNRNFLTNVWDKIRRVIWVLR